MCILLIVTKNFIQLSVPEVCGWEKQSKIVKGTGGSLALGDTLDVGGSYF